MKIKRICLDKMFLQTLTKIGTVSRNEIGIFCFELAQIYVLELIVNLLDHLGERFGATHQEVESDADAVVALEPFLGAVRG